VGGVTFEARVACARDFVHPSHVDGGDDLVLSNPSVRAPVVTGILVVL